MSNFKSILGESPYGRQPSEISYSSFYPDLNIDLIVKRILLQWTDYPLQKYFYYPAYTPDGVRRRREIYEELEDAQLCDDLVTFSQRMKRARQYLDYRDQLWDMMQRQAIRKDLTNASARTASEVKHQHLLYDAASEYVDAVEDLVDIFTRFPQIKSESLLELWEFLQEYCAGEAFTTLKRDVESMREALSQLHFQFEVKQNKLTMYEVYDEADAREEFMERCGMKPPESAAGEMVSPFPNVLDLKEFEGLLLSMLHQPHKEIFKQLKDFVKHHEDFAVRQLPEFEEEIQVFLAAHQFIREMREYGFPFVHPTAEGQGDWYLQDNYDVALAIKYAFTPEEVITNDAYLAEGEQMFLITGPNQGGKTTFARAVGQAVWFHQMGFPVPGTRAELPVFSCLLTHFPQEEDIETGAGRLKEELERLAPMVSNGKRNGFVIFNELFATATTYDALIMGERMIHEFLNRDFCGIYVTHFHKLAACDGRLVSLVAQVEDTDERKRTFHIVRAEAKGIAYAQTFAQKYRLRREEILTRLDPEGQHRRNRG